MCPTSIDSSCSGSPSHHLPSWVLPGFRPAISTSACRLKDVGKAKAEVAAERVMARVAGVRVTPHFCRIEEKPVDFYEEFHVIILGLDSLEARRYMNQVACSLLGTHHDWAHAAHSIRSLTFHLLYLCIALPSGLCFRRVCQANRAG